MLNVIMERKDGKSQKTNKQKQIVNLFFPLTERFSNVPHILRELK